MNLQEIINIIHPKPDNKTKTKGVILITDNRPKTKS